MEPLIYYSYIFAVILVIVGMVLRRQTQQLIWMYAFIAAAALVMVGAVMFPAMNLGRNVALHKFNMMGLDIILYATIAVTLPTLGVMLWKRQWWPHSIVAILGAAQVVIVLLLKFYYSRI